MRALSLKIQKWLEGQPAHIFSIFAIVAAFSSYFSMYAFRKPFAAGSYEDIAAKNYFFSAGHYFTVKIEYTDISENDFKLKMESHQKNLKASFNDSKKIESEIFRKLSQIEYE